MSDVTWSTALQAARVRDAWPTVHAALSVIVDLVLEQSLLYRPTWPCAHVARGSAACVPRCNPLRLTSWRLHRATQVYEKCSSRPHETWLFLNYLGKENLLFLHGKAAKDMRLR